MSEGILGEGPVVICAATGLEAKGCRAGIAGAGPRFEVLLTGMGMAAAGRALRARLSSGPRPSLVVSSGVTGAKTPGLGLGEWILANELALASGEVLAVESVLARAVARTGLRWHQAQCRTLEAVSGEGKDHSPEEPLVVDMESWALAEVAGEAQVPFDFFRLVSDTVEHPFPEAVGTLVAASTATRMGDKARMLWAGTRQVLGAPSAVASFAWRSRLLPTQLAEGWAALTAALMSGGR
jgi:nucleoside phosphorylase